MVNRRLLRLSAVLLLVGEVALTYLVESVHPGGGATNQASFTAYAASQGWAAIHLGEFISTTVQFAGLLVLFFALNVVEGTPRYLGIFAAVSTAVSLALAGVLMAVDGVALKQAVDAWASAAAADKAARFASAEAIRWLEWGVNNYQNFMFGLALVLYGATIVWTARVPRPMGYLMGVSGLAFMILGYLVGTRGFTSAGFVPTQVGWISLYASTIWLLIVALRMRVSVQQATGYVQNKGGAL